MAADAAIIVSKRLRAAGLAILCITLAQFVLASCQAEPTPMAARVIAFAQAGNTPERS
ncbi:hypothetical protein [Caulobacter segnis]|uniref:Uncharacterized protein n=1 Tax=Caulobacter segnis TaxID=88688 RepID=A0A2W5V0F9_9CAUL|nr:hypothetical protein [Caulobacter segnis]PZR32207.1 MAG: hypothetical protein DI526_17305 [Caulobacter segnis]